MLKIGEHYINKKTGKTYVIEGFSIDSETLETRVLYKRIEDFLLDQVWDRPIELFKVKFTNEDGSDIE